METALPGPEGGDKIRESGEVTDKCRGPDIQRGGDGSVRPAGTPKCVRPMSNWKPRLPGPLEPNTGSTMKNLSPMYLFLKVKKKYQGDLRSIGKSCV